MDSVIEGSGEEIAKYAQEHPYDRFRLTLVSESRAKFRPGGPDDESWERVMLLIHSFKGMVNITLPLEATSTESLYD